MPNAGPLILAIDQGTTSSKALLVDSDGAILARGAAPVAIRFPRPGWVEQDAENIWSSVLAAVAQCLARAPHLTPHAVAISNQRESVVAWSRTTGRPAGPVLGWQDARTADVCAKLAAASADDVRARTGLAIDAMFSAPKMRWLLDAAAADGAEPGDIRLGTVDSWLVYRLTGGAAATVEAGNASRTLLFDLNALDWHPELLDLFGIPRHTLGDISASDARAGVTVGNGPLPAGLPIAAVLADSHAALYTHQTLTGVALKATYGTGSSVMARIPALTPAPPGIATTLAWLTDAAAYAREGNILASGSALDWTASLLGCTAEEAGGAYLTRIAAESSDGTVLVPAFSGLGAPHWDRDATAVLTGLTSTTGPQQVARAALEAVAHQIVDVVEVMESDGATRADVLNADGGATASATLMQVQADLLGRPVRVADVRDASPVGAALLAAAALGADAPAPPQSVDVVRPRLDEETREQHREQWRAAVRRARLPLKEGSP
ncbi:MAG TPA: FGGY family carbohydrate kinase [Jatrophihabitantaceae bacterium]|jgi:glycerol kinase